MAALIGGGLKKVNSGIWYHEHEHKEQERKRKESGLGSMGFGFGSTYDSEATIVTPRRKLIRSSSYDPESVRKAPASHHSTDDEDDRPHHSFAQSSAGPRESALSRKSSKIDGARDPNWASHAELTLMTPEMRSQRLIGNANPRYRWPQYWKTDEELAEMSKPLRRYYERTNNLIQQYTFVDKLLDSSLPHDLLQEYKSPAERKAQDEMFKHGFTVDVPKTIVEESSSGRRTPEPETNGVDPLDDDDEVSRNISVDVNAGHAMNDFYDPPRGLSIVPSMLPVANQHPKIKRTPKNIYKIPENGPPTPSSERTPLLRANPNDLEIPHEIAEEEEEQNENMAASTDFENKMPDWEPEEETDSQSSIVTWAIYINLAANTILLILKIIVTIMTSSVSVLASLVDAALDFLSTAIVFLTTRLIAHSASDQQRYPVGRRRLEPIGVLVFSVIMITAFVQVALEGFKGLTSSAHVAIQLSTSAVVIMSSTVGIKFLCWLYCKAIRNSSVQALAQDAMTDVVFNIFSIIFPLVGYYANVWWLDPLGGILLACYVIISWSSTSLHHIDTLAGAAASADERNVLLYLTMRFARPIRQIQGLNAYHAGDKLNVEADIVLDEDTSLRDAHDLGESLQYVLESVPTVDRAFVHLDYEGWNVSFPFSALLSGTN